MRRALIGAVAGLGFAAGILAGTHRVLAQLVSPMQAMEHWVVYLSMVLGAGFGAVAASLSRPEQQRAGHGVEQGVKEDRPG